jgi:hypothetical protein
MVDFLIETVLIARRYDNTSFLVASGIVNIQSDSSPVIQAQRKLIGISVRRKTRTKAGLRMS